MRGLIIQRRSIVAEAFRWLAAGVPDAFRRFWRGPVGSAQVTARGLGKVEGGGWLRPVDLSLAPEAMMAIRLSIPTKGRHELPHAVALAIRHDTPFEADELVAQAVAIERGAESETYLIHAAPRRLIGEAVRTLGRGRLGRITANAGPDLTPAVLPRRRVGKWLGWAPIVIIIGTGAVIAYDLLAGQERKVAELSVQADRVLVELRQVTARLEAIETREAAGNRIAGAIAAAPPAIVMLERARRMLPEAAEVLQIEIRQKELRLSLRTPDALGDMSRFVEAGWQVTIEGAITADATSGREIATLKLSPPARLR